MNTPNKAAPQRSRHAARAMAHNIRHAVRVGDESVIDQLIDVMGDEFMPHVQKFHFVATSWGNWSRAYTKSRALAELAEARGVDVKYLTDDNYTVWKVPGVKLGAYDFPGMAGGKLNVAGAELVRRNKAAS